MAQELITVETRVGHTLSGGDITLYTPAVGEKIHLLMMLIHALQKTTAGTSQTLDIKAGATILLKIFNDTTNPQIPDQSSGAATGSLGLDSAKNYDPIKSAQIKLPVPPNSAGVGVITNANPLIIGQGTNSPDFVTTSVWLVREV